jgi:hypothetical protein
MTFVTAVFFYWDYSLGVLNRGGVIMLQPQRTRERKVKIKKEKELLGTLFAVFGVGLFIVVSWLAVYLLYLSR